MIKQRKLSVCWIDIMVKDKIVFALFGIYFQITYMWLLGLAKLATLFHVLAYQFPFNSRILEQYQSSKEIVIEK